MYYNNLNQKHPGVKRSDQIFNLKALLYTNQNEWPRPPTFKVFMMTILQNTVVLGAKYL